jgi:DNA-binding response OmpR family regulator
MVEARGNILLVDDDEAILQVMSKILQKEGYTIAIAETGRKAIEKIKNGSFDAVFIDLGLPDVKGLDLLRIIGAIRPTVKRIVLTGSVLTAGESKSLLQEADSLLTKPCTAQELVGVLKTIVGKKP